MASEADARMISESRSSEYPPVAYAWFVTIALQLAYAMALVDRQILALLVQPMKADLQISDTQFSVLAGVAFVICYSVFGLFFGRLADRTNRRNMVIGGILVWSMATIGCGLAHNYQQLFLCRMLVGVGEAALNPAAYSMIADYFPKETRSRAASAYTMGIFTGAGLGLVVSATALTSIASAATVNVPVLGIVRSWQAIFLFVGILGLPVAVLLTAIKEPSRKETVRALGSRADLRTFLRRKAGIIALIIAAFALNGLIYYGVGTWTPALFIRKFHWTPPHIGLALGLIQLICGTGGILVGGWWVSRPKVVTINNILFTTSRDTMLVMSVIVLIAGFSPYASLSIAGIALLVFAGGIVSGQSAVALFHVTPNMFRGQVVAAYILTGTLLGFGVGATLIAAITDYVFHNDKAVGASLAIVVVAASLLGGLCLNRAAKSRELNLNW